MMTGSSLTRLRDCVRVTVPSDPRWVPLLRAAAHELAAQEGFGPSEAHDLELAVNEALANVIQHSYEGACDRPIDVQFRSLRSKPGPNGIEVLVRDFGRQVDPASIRPRELDQVRPGGLGVHLIRSLMDEAEYSCPADCGMQLRMVKYVQRRQPTGPAKMARPP